MSQIHSNNSSHATKKKGRKNTELNTKFITHENTFSRVSCLGPRAQMSLRNIFDFLNKYFQSVNNKICVAVF